MNNKRWVHRLAKGDSFYNVGPYGYLARKLYEQEGKTKDQVQPLKDLLLSKERWSNHTYSDCIGDVLSKYPVFVERGCFSTFKAHRPGPFDDPLMKQNLLSKFGSRTNIVKSRFSWTGFAFDSLEQLHNWFNDEREFKLLMHHGFKVHSEKVRQEDIIDGLKQVWVLQEK